MNQPRLITITIDSILAIFKDYLGEDDVPRDARPIALQYKPTERGKLALLIESNHLSNSGPVEARFDLRQTFGG